MPKLKCLILTILLSLCVSVVWGADQADWPNIYIDSDAAGSGVGSQADPYAGFDEINWTTGGDNSVFDAVAANQDVTINLQRGDTFNGTMVQAVGGSATHPITIQPYGTGAKPIIKKVYSPASWTNVGGTSIYYAANTAPAEDGGDLLSGYGDFEDDPADIAEWEQTESGVGDATISRVLDAGNAANGTDGYLKIVIDTQGASSTEIILKSPQFNYGYGDVYKLHYYIKGSGVETIWPPQAMGYSTPGCEYGLDLQMSDGVTASWVEVTYYFESRYDSTKAAGQPHGMIRWKLGIGTLGLEADVGPNTGFELYLDEITVHKCTNSSGAFYGDYGTIIADGVDVGIREDAYGDLDADGEWWVNENNRFLFYLFSEVDGSPVNPATRWTTVELSAARPLMEFEGEGHFRVNNIDFRYSGFNGIYADPTGFFHQTTSVDDIDILDCDFIINGGKWGNGHKTRSGNGITFWDDCSDILVERCYFEGNYDNGITNQGTSGTQDGVTYRNNLFYRNHISIASWLNGGTKIDNIHIYNNTIVDSGYEQFASSRPDGQRACGIRFGAHDGTVTIGAIHANNNIIYRTTGSDDCLMEVDDFMIANATGLNLDNNSFYQENATDGGINTTFKGGEYDFEHILGSAAGYFQDDESLCGSCINTNPLFVSTTSNFRLLAGSPCIWTGKDLSISTDLDGRAYHATTPSMGCYEFAGHGADGPTNLGLGGGL